MNIATATPVEIDTELARLDGEYTAIYNRLAGAIDSLHRTAGDRKRWIGRVEKWQMSTEEAIEAAKAQSAATPRTYLNAQAEDALARFDELTAAMAKNFRDSGVLEDEYNRRPWTRAFLADTKSEGHVHSTRDCSTCNNGLNRTRFGWQPQYSGADEAAIIKDAGYRACTVCYPNAPVGTAKTLPTKMFSEDEITAAEAREVRAAAKAAREAKRLEKALLPDGTALRVPTEGSITVLETLAQARTWLTDSYWWRAGHPSFPATARTIIAEAVAAKEGKTVEVVLAEATKRAAKRR